MYSFGKEVSAFFKHGASVEQGTGSMTHCWATVGGCRGKADGSSHCCVVYDQILKGILLVLVLLYFGLYTVSTCECLSCADQERGFTSVSGPQRALSDPLGLSFPINSRGSEAPTAVL